MRRRRYRQKQAQTRTGNVRSKFITYAQATDSMVTVRPSQNRVRTGENKEKLCCRGNIGPRRSRWLHYSKHHTSVALPPILFIRLTKGVGIDLEFVESEIEE